MRLTKEQILKLQSLLIEDLSKSKENLHNSNRLENFDNGYLCGILAASSLTMETGEFVLEERINNSSMTCARLLHFSRELHLIAHYLIDGHDECPEVEHNVTEIDRLLVRNITEVAEYEALRRATPRSRYEN